jgi:hypothetical protein
MKLKAILGLCFAVAMLVCAIAAQGASAQEAYTCASGGGKKDFTNNHCTNASKVAENTGSFGHVAFAGSTAITGTGGVTKLKSVSSGVELELQSTELTGTGTMENKEGNASGTGVITYKTVTVAKPAGLGCKVKGGEVVTAELAASTKGLTNELLFTPKSGATGSFATFTVEGCSIGALNHAYTAKGSVKGQTDGATTKFTHSNTTAQGTLTLQGQLAGIEGELTIHGPNGNGLALT